MKHALAFAAGLAALGIPDETQAPEELGAVAWARELEPALKLAERTDRPVLLLFQEIPG